MISNFLLALLMLALFLIFRNMFKNLRGNLFIKYKYYMFGVPYFIFLIHTFRHINVSYTLILLFSILSITPYICFIMLYNTKTLRGSQKKYTFDEQLTDFYTKKFEYILKNIKILIYSYNGDENLNGIFTKNLWNKHRIYLNLRIFDMFNEDEKDAVILHELGHIFHKNYLAITVSSIIAFSLVFAVSAMLYFSVTLNYLFNLSRVGRLIFNIFILIGIIISVFLIKYNRKIINYITEFDQKQADYFSLKYIKPEYLTSALRKLTDYREYMHPEYESFFEKYFGIRSHNIERATHIIIRKYK